MRHLLLGAGLAMSGCGPFPFCVARGTRVRTPNGLVPVENLSVGDEIVVIEPSTGMTATSRLTALTSAMRECGTLSLGSRSLTVTSDHPLYDPLAKDFFPAGDWLLGTRKQLLSFTGDQVETITVANVVPFSCIAQVFDLTVEHEWHTFLAEDLVVHNKQPPPCTLADGSNLYNGQTSTQTCACDGGTGTYVCYGGALVCEDCAKELNDAGFNDAGTRDGGADGGP